MSNSKVDPDTGLTPAQQQEKWSRLFESPLVQPKKVKVAKSIAKRIPTARQPRTSNTVKPLAIEMFRAGKTVKEVSEMLGITYANAHYYSRFK